MVDSRSRIAVVSFGALLCAPVSAQVTQQVSVDSAGVQGDGDSYGGSISADGRFVVLVSSASNLALGDTNGTWDVFVHDRQSGSTALVSVNSAGVQGDLASGGISPISPDGRYVAFRSLATNLVPDDTNGNLDVFVHDRENGETTRVSIGPDGRQGNQYSDGASLSADGRFVAFYSRASTLVAGDTNVGLDVFVRDRQAGVTSIVSVDSAGVQGNTHSWEPSISDDGRFVAFHSDATNLIPGDTNGKTDIFVHDRQGGVTTRVSVSSAGVQGDHESVLSSISADGRFVAFQSSASNLVSGDTNGWDDVFVRDRQLSTTTRMSVGWTGMQGNLDSWNPSISGDGLFVAFLSYATNLVPGDTNGWGDAFVHDRRTGITTRESVSSNGGQGNHHSYSGAISADGRFVVFSGRASNIVPGETKDTADAFVHDRDATGFTSLCEPGVADVILCPCSNPSSGLGGGCNNASATGGAALAASGVSYLSLDSLVFITDGENQNALSFLLQGNAAISTGLAYGHGVRCVGGTTLRRLFTKTASGGSITVPDFEAGDPTISDRSSASGDSVHPGESRWYLVTYRDPVELGECPGSIRFNATQTGQITWWP